MRSKRRRHSDLNLFRVGGGGSPTACPCVATNYSGFIIYSNGVFYLNSKTRLTDITDGVIHVQPIRGSVERNKHLLESPMMA